MDRGAWWAPWMGSSIILYTQLNTSAKFLDFPAFYCV